MKQNNQDVLKAGFITTNDFIIDGDCIGCKTSITRYNSIIKNGTRTCICCEYVSPNGWITSRRSSN